ncbi:hypothetical protein V1477_015708 [Vespula maculifrons]|uniref:Uncharacterized protein n=1 Tax=Vespula maculifrons TaxID=7453 RepID=A0ABD2BAY3_VESMC
MQMHSKLITMIIKERDYPGHGPDKKQAQVFYRLEQQINSFKRRTPGGARNRRTRAITCYRWQRADHNVVYHLSSAPVCRPQYPGDYIVPNECIYLCRFSNAKEDIRYILKFKGRYCTKPSKAMRIETVYTRLRFVVCRAYSRSDIVENAINDRYRECPRGGCREEAAERLGRKTGTGTLRQESRQGQLADPIVLQTIQHSGRSDLHLRPVGGTVAVTTATATAAAAAAAAAADSIKATMDERRE